jgi:hypothetical protein
VFVDYEKYLKRYVFVDHIEILQDSNYILAGTSSTRQADLDQQSMANLN